MDFFKRYKFFTYTMLGLILITAINSSLSYHAGHHNYVKKLEIMTNNLKEFISAHNGRFPGSQDEFKAYIGSDKRLDVFSVRYGICVNELHTINGILYDRSGNPILLIKNKNDGIWTFIWGLEREKQSSLSLYQLMLNYSALNEKTE